jgi:hypothetical protein
LVVPLFGALERSIDVEDHTPVVELHVMDNLTDEELDFGSHLSL